MGVAGAIVVVLAGALAAWLALVMAGRRRVTFSIHSHLNADELWPLVETFIRGANRRSGSQVKEGDGWIETAYPLSDGTRFVVQQQAMDIDRPRAVAHWVRIGRAPIRDDAPWFWDMTMVEPLQDGGSRLTGAAGGRMPFMALIGFVSGYFSLRRICHRGRIEMGAAPRAGMHAAKKANGPARFAAGPARTKWRRAEMRPELMNDLITSLIACASFIVLWGWQAGILLIPIVLLHEYGHVLAYQLTGKTGNRLMLVPFFGGLAIAGSDHNSEFERAFCAIMGPAICLPLSAALTFGAYVYDGTDAGWWMTYGAFICASMNAANLLPLLPLDGGHSAESLARSVAPHSAGPAMATLTVGGAIILAAAGYENWALMIALWGFPSVMRSMSGPYPHMRPMDFRGGTLMVAFHLATFAIHAGLAAFVYYNLYF